jgi:hypothetical protein
MKFSFAALLLCACGGSTSSSPPISSLGQNMTEDDYRESLAYQASLDRIADRMLREKHTLEACYQTEAPKVCVKKQKEYCEIDTILDSRQGHHVKPYCH